MHLHTFLFIFTLNIKKYIRETNDRLVRW